MCEYMKKLEHKFFILVPVYNVESYVENCIESVLKQKYDRFRLILVDDGSSDKSGEICEYYASKDARIVVIHQKNCGLISARRTGVRKALEEATEEDYIVFLDSDDALKTNALHVINETICQHDSDMILYGMDHVFNGQIIEKYRAELSHKGVVSNKKELYKIVFLNNQYNPLWRKAVSSKLLSDDDYSRFYHISRGEDLLQDIVLYERCKKVVFLSDSLYNYTYNPASITKSINPSNYIVDTTVRREVYKFLRQQNVWNEVEFDEYLAFCGELLKSEILLIGTFKTTIDCRREIFKKLKSDRYYAMLLKKDASNSFLIRLLCNENYVTLCILSTIHLLMMKTGHMIKRIIKNMTKKN